MQNNGRQRRGRRGRQRGVSEEQQPLTNESAIGLQSLRKKRPSGSSLPPTAYDPNYVPGKNPQYIGLDDAEPEQQRSRRRRRRRGGGQSQHNGQSHGHHRDNQPRDGQPRDGQPRDGQPREGQQREGQQRYGHKRQGRQRRHRQGQQGQGQQEPGQNPQHQRQRHRYQDQQQPFREGENRGRNRRRRRNRNRNPNHLPEGAQPLTSESPLLRGAGNRQRRQRGKPGKGRLSLGMVKRRLGRETGRSKVYTSDMFLYKENLDPRKPAERKMRSRRHKPDSETNNQE